VEPVPPPQESAPIQSPEPPKPEAAPTPTPAESASQVTAITELPGLPGMGLVDINAAIAMNIHDAAGKAAALKTLGKAMSHLGRYYETLAELTKSIGQ
jgi:hypothetical protein